MHTLRLTPPTDRIPATLRDMVRRRVLDQCTPDAPVIDTGMTSSAIILLLQKVPHLAYFVLDIVLTPSPSPLLLPPALVFYDPIDIFILI
jgi:hypothetical protein